MSSFDDSLRRLQAMARRGEQAARDSQAATLSQESERIAEGALATHLASPNPHAQYLLASDAHEVIDDRVAALLQAGDNITLSYDDAAGRLTIAATGGTAISRGPWASRPASGSAAGQSYLATNAPYLSHWDGTSWATFGPIRALTPPPTTGWSWANQSTASVVEQGSIRVVGGVGQTGFAGRVRALPAAPYTITMLLRLGVPIFGGSGYCGWGWRASANGRWHLIYLQGTSFFNQTWTSPTSFAATYGSTTASQVAPAPLLWVRMTDDGTNRAIWLGRDPENLSRWHTIGRTDFLVPDQIGIVAGAGATATESLDVELLHYDVS